MCLSFIMQKDDCDTDPEFRFPENNMKYYDHILNRMKNGPLEQWSQILRSKINTAFSSENHANNSMWMDILSSLPDNPPVYPEVINGAIRFADEDEEKELRDRIQSKLMSLHPWRKGPYSIHGVHIDTEWRSDLKWDRLINHIQPLNGRTILDVGCGSGYHCWRMALEEARLVIGIDPYMISVYQFLAVNHFSKKLPLTVLPVGIEDVSPELNAFDTVFSMGMLHHRRSPLDHLYQLRGCLRSGGELVLETLVIKGETGEVLVPEKRYAKMRNVWFIPSPKTLESWLKRCGFKNVRIVDVTRTAEKEQHATEWMRFESLADYLSTDDPSLTIEGLPAPVRGILIAEKP